MVWVGSKFTHFDFMEEGVMALDFSIKLTQSDKTIQNKIRDGVVKHLNNSFGNTATKRKLQNFVGETLRKAIQATPEYHSMIGGTLRFELGLLKAEPKLTNIIDTWVNGIQVRVRRINRNLKGGIKIKAVRRSYADVLGLPDASFLTEKNEENDIIRLIGSRPKKNEKRTRLHWLQWMLTEGNNTIIQDYDVSFRQGQGRTGGAIMVSGTRWGVPPEFSGTKDNNFVTRAIDSVSTIMEDGITQILKESVRR